jgi:hypothetical protein
MKKTLWTLMLALALVLPVASANHARAAKRKVNACGCYGDGVTCTCQRSAKCGCPGECEPKGCEEARQKKLQKEIEAETKKAKEQEAEQQAKMEAKEGGGEGKDAEEGKAKAPPPKPMSPAAKRQFGKLIDAYLAVHPENKNKMLWEVRAELQ